MSVLLHLSVCTDFHVYGEDILITQSADPTNCLSSLQGCTKGPHNKEKPPEPVKPEVKSSAEKKDIDDQKPKFNEYIISAPKPQEAIQRPRYVWGCSYFYFFFPVSQYFNETL